MIKIMSRIAKVHIGMIVSLSLILLVCSPSSALSMPTANMHATTEGDRVMSARVEVELDIFSGNPNPTWILSDADGVLFIKKLTTLQETTAKKLSNNLGYRGFIAKVVDETEESLVQIQNGTIQLSQNDINVYYSDQNRDLERWLLNTGKPSLRSDLFKIVESDFPKNSTAQSCPSE
jgi:hypothetical protein